MTAPIVFTAAGMLLTHGLLAPLGITPSREVVKVLAEVTLALVLFSDASRAWLHQLRADLGLCLRLLGIGLPLAIGLARWSRSSCWPGRDGRDTRTATHPPLVARPARGYQEAADDHKIRR